MLRNLGIRWQILSALALPVLVLGLISSQVTYQALIDMREASQSRQLAQAAGGFADLVEGLQAERALSVAVLLDQPDAAAKLKTTRAAVDQGLAKIRTQVYDDSSFSDAVNLVFTRAASSHAELTSLRAEVDAGKLEPRSAVNRYSRVINTDVEVPSDLAGTLSSEDSAANFQQFSQLSRAGEALAQEQLIGNSAIAAGVADTVDQRDLGAEVAAGQLALSAFRRLANQEQLTALQSALAGPSARSSDLALARAAFQLAGTTGSPTVAQAAWTEMTTGQLAALRTALNSVNASGVALSTNEYNSARKELQLTLAGAIGIVALTLFLALAMSRRISAPLRRLTLAATQIRDELPKIVESVQSDDELELHLPVVQTLGSNEVSLLAAAFVDVNAVTVEIAREQSRLRAAVADMFVNIARRNQVLLSRQLSLIDQLERNEVNPDALEELFRLDHLATRMRRNAESLLVLAGIESGRRLREPMPLSDVVRTATSEIEHYSRVTLSLAADPPVYAHLALPIAHLLAEVLENATNFSDPGSAVVVMSSATAQGIRMTIADDGLGMSAQELVEINARIEEPPTAEALSSQRLGLFVVGRLAQRLDAKVTLTSGRARGTAVLIDLPSSLFVTVSADGSIPERPAVSRAAALAAVPDQGGSSRTPDVAGGTPFVGAFPGAPAVPAAFDSAAFDAVNALEPVWSPQPDNLPFGEESSRIVDQFAAPALPARRGATVAEPVQPLTMPVVDPVAGPTAAPTSSAFEVPSQSSPDWATSDWVSEPVEPEPASVPISASTPTIAPSTNEPAAGASLFSGFRSSRPNESAAPGASEPVTPPVTPPSEPSGSGSAPAGFLDSAEAVDGSFEADGISPTPSVEPEPEQWPAWDGTQSPTVSVAPSWNDVATDEYTPANSASAFEAAPMPADSTSATWAPEAPTEAPTPSAPAADAAQPWESTPDTYETVTWSPAADVTDNLIPEPWTPEAAVPVADPVAPEISEPWSPIPAGTSPAAQPAAQPAAAQPAVTESSAAEPSAAQPAVTESSAAEPSAAQPSAAEPWAPVPVTESWAPAPTWTPEPVVQTWTPEPAPVVEAWTPEPAPVVEAWTPEPAPVVEAWTPEPAPVVEAWTPEPAPVVEAWTPEPAVETWTPEPAPVVEAWTPEPVVEAWTPETAAQTWTPEPTAEVWSPEPAAEARTAAAGPETWTPVPTPETWTPEPTAEAWTPEPAAEAWTPETNSWAAEPESEAKARPEPKSELSQTLSAAIDILPARTSIRSALGRGRRKNDASDGIGLPFNGGFDPIAPAREFARREGFGSAPEPEANGGAPVEGTESPAGLVPEQPKDSAPFVERRQHPRSSEKSSGRSALASEALTELSRLSSYSPTSMPDTNQAGLQRRTPHDVPVDEQPQIEPAGQRARTAASVRSMLAGFKAGVERGRTSPSANRPAAELNQPPQPREPR